MRPERAPVASLRALGASQSSRGAKEPGALARLSLWLLVVLVVLLAGCSAPPHKITLWHSYRGGEELALRKAIESFEALQGVKITVLAVPNDAYAAKLEAAIPRGNGPDVFIDAHERLGSFIKNKLVAPVGDALPDADVAAFDAPAVQAVTIDGVRFAVPLASKCLALYVGGAYAGRQFDKLEDIAALRKELPATSFPLAYEAQSAFFHAPFAAAFGANLLGPDGNFGFVGPGAEQSAELVRDLTRARVIPEEPSGALVKQLFLAGRAATVISGPWLAAELDQNTRYTVQPLPIVGASGKPMRPLLTVEGAMLTPDGATRDVARALAKHLASPGAAKVRAITGKQVVTTRATWTDAEVAKDPVLEAFHRAAEQAIPMPSSTRMRAVWNPAEQGLRKVLRGDATAAVALAEANARFIDVLRPPPAPPGKTPLMLLLGLFLLALAALGAKYSKGRNLRAEFRASLPSYAYVMHTALVVLALVVVPLVAGTATSFFAGTRDEPRYVGFYNYIQILTARGGDLLGHGSFYLTLLVTLLWTVANVTLHAVLGMVLGTLLARPWLRLKAVYRVLLVLPWAVPSYVTALAWKGMFHRQFGAINAILGLFGVQPVSWFSKFSTAFSANLATNVWLGFPFMMVVTLGALTSIPKDVLEAAEIDGATRWQRFRYVTLPLLWPQLLPSIVLGAVWTFNMFNVVFLVSGGEPDGATDILVSEAYRWAFTRDAQYGYAAAYAVLIFFLLFGGTRLLGRLAPKAAQGVLG